MSISQFLQEATIWLAWSGLSLGFITIIAFLFNWGFKFRLIGASVFTLLLSCSCWAFQESYTPPVTVEGAKYAPVVYDNGGDLVVAQVPEDFPSDAIEPSLKQISENLKGGGRNGAKVTIRIRKIEEKGPGISTPIVIGEATRDSFAKTTSIQTKERISEINKMTKNDSSNVEEAIDEMITSKEINEQSSENYPNVITDESPLLLEFNENT